MRSRGLITAKGRAPTHSSEMERVVVATVQDLWKDLWKCGQPDFSLFRWVRVLASFAELLRC